MRTCGSPYEGAYEAKKGGRGSPENIHLMRPKGRKPYEERRRTRSGPCIERGRVTDSVGLPAVKGGVGTDDLYDQGGEGERGWLLGRGKRGGPASPEIRQETLLQMRDEFREKKKKNNLGSCLKKNKQTEPVSTKKKDKFH